MNWDDDINFTMRMAAFLRRRLTKTLDRNRKFETSVFLLFWLCNMKLSSSNNDL